MQDSTPGEHEYILIQGGLNFSMSLILFSYTQLDKVNNRLQINVTYPKAFLSVAFRNHLASVRNYLTICRFPESVWLSYQS